MQNVAAFEDFDDVAKDIFQMNEMTDVNPVPAIVQEEVEVGGDGSMC